MNKNQTRNRLANLMRFRKPYKATDFLVSSNELRVKKDVYSLRKIKQLEIRQLGFKKTLSISFHWLWYSPLRLGRLFLSLACLCLR